MSLHQWEAEEAAANQRAKIMHPKRDLHAKVKCTKAVMKAKHNYWVAVQEARTVRCSELKESKTAYSKAIIENAAAKSLHCAELHQAHAKHMQELEEWTLDAENKSRPDFLLAYQAILCNAPLSLKEDLHSSYHILLGQSTSPPQFIPFAKAPQEESQSSAHASPKPEPKQSQWPKRQNPSPDLQGDTSIDEDSPMGLQEDLPHFKGEKTSDWFSSLKPSHADAFNRDSGPIKEAREHYFTTHPWDWVQSNTDDLSDIFRELAQGAGLLGKSIYKIQWSWDGSDHLKHGNYVLWSLPKGLKFLRAVSAKESPKVMGLCYHW